MGTLIIILVIIFAGDFYDLMKKVSLAEFANSCLGLIFSTCFFLGLVYFLTNYLSTSSIFQPHIEEIKYNDIAYELAIVSLWWLVPCSYYVLVIFMAGSGVRSQTFFDEKGKSYQAFYQTNEAYPEIIENGMGALPGILLCLLSLKIYFFNGVGRFINNFLNSSIEYLNLNWALSWIIIPIILFIVSIAIFSRASKKIEYGVVIAIAILFLNWLLIIGYYLIEWLFAK